MPQKEQKTPSTTPSILSPAMRTAVPSGSLTRSKVARRLGVSVTTLRRMEGTLLHPQTGEGGVRMFDAEEVEAAVIRVRRRERPEEPETGAVAAEVFTLFDEGVHPVDVIKKLLLAPNVVESLHVQWTRMRGHLVIPVEIRLQLESDLVGDRPGPGGWEIDSPTALRKKIVELLAPQACNRCQDKPASFCRECAKTIGSRLA
jgi:hypothetical protein